MEGKRHTDGVHTEVERTSRFMAARRVPAISSEATIAVQQQIFSDMPACLRRSTTLDNGHENHLHAQLKDLGIQTYFAGPYSFWQRGTNENGNWHLRYYFPKGTDFATVTNEELQDVMADINDRPRRILGYRTAREVFIHLVEQEARAAISD